MEDIECEGKSVSEAVEAALRKSGLRRDQVEVQIVQEGATGFMGIGAKLARVRIREKRWAADGSQIPQGAEAPPPPKVSSRAAPMPKPERRKIPRAAPESRPTPAPQRAPERARAPRHNPDAPRVVAPRPQAARAPEPPRQSPHSPRTQERAPDVKITAEQAKTACEEAIALLKEILPLMHIEAKVSAQWDSEQERVKAVVDTEDHERLIGPDGKTLESLQFLITLIITRRRNLPIAVWVDTRGYWEKKEKSILSEAQSGVDAVKTTGKPFRLPPMDAPLRRLIHRSLAGHPDVLTASEGEGSWRKIVLKPRK